MDSPCTSPVCPVLSGLTPHDFIPPPSPPPPSTQWTHLVLALVTATVAALHGVTPHHPNLPPHYHPRCCLLDALHHKAAVLQVESRAGQVQDPRQRLGKKPSNKKYSEGQWLPSDGLIVHRKTQTSRVKSLWTTVWVGAKPTTVLCDPTDAP